LASKDFQLFYKVTGPWRALCCFATRVETWSPPIQAASRQMPAVSQQYFCDADIIPHGGGAAEIKESS